LDIYCGSRSIIGGLWWWRLCTGRYHSNPSSDYPSGYHPCGYHPSDDYTCGYHSSSNYPCYYGTCCGQLGTLPQCCCHC
jgi:hypothetical protein